MKPNGHCAVHFTIVLMAIRALHVTGHAFPSNSLQNSNADICMNPNQLRFSQQALSFLAWKASVAETLCAICTKFFSD